MMRQVLAVLVVLGLLFLIVGCSQQAEPLPEPQMSIGPAGPVQRVGVLPQENVTVLLEKQEPLDLSDNLDVSMEEINWITD